MGTYKINVNYEGVGRTLRVNPRQLTVKLQKKSSGKIEHALVTWMFNNLPDGVIPVITFDSQEVIASGPATTLGAKPQIDFEIKSPSTAQEGRDYLASYKISVSGSAEILPLPEMEQPSLVVVPSPDPPGSSAPDPVSSEDAM